MTEPVRYQTSGDGVATITLARAETMNSLDTAAKEALLDCLLRAGGAAEVRAVVLTGTGRAFSAGQDLGEHAEALRRGTRVGSTVRDHYNPIVRTITGMPKPVVAAVNGVAAGAGASLAFACDLRLAAASARFLLAFAKVGLGGDAGATWTLQRLVGYGRAMELLLLAEPLGAEQAAAIGLVNRVVPDAELASAAAELAGRLAAGPPAAYAAIKSGLEYASSRSLDEALENEAHLQDEAGATADHHEATAAFLAKKTPTFTGR